MPLATSPYQQNDYTSISSRTPYRLNIQAVAQTAMALDQFWKKGAERVKSAYDSALNLSLTSDENKEIKKKFLEEAQQQLTQLASQDLSNPSVQRQGIGIFKPIFEDQAIMQDDHLTKLKQSIFAEAEQYKRDPKTKGAGFHMDNLAYALQGFQGFNNKTARNQIGDVFENAKDSQYIPFYDDSKEKIEILKACKANKLSNMNNNGPYLSTYSDQSLSESKLYGCLEGALSSQSRQQNRISASVRYGHDYEAVRNDYIDTATGKKNYYGLQKTKMEASRDALSKVAGNEEAVRDLDAQIKMLDDEVGKLDKHLATVHTWDAKYIQDNYEDLAANAYFKRANGAFASAFATTDIQNTLKADPIYITHYVQNEMNKRQAAAAQDKIDLENLQFQHELLTGGKKDKDGKPITDMLQRVKACADDPTCQSKIGQFLTEAVKEPATTSNKINAEINDLTGQKMNLIRDLVNDPFVSKTTAGINPGGLLDFDENKYKTMWDILNVYIADADDSDPNKQRLLEATNKLLEIENKKTMLKGIVDDATAQVGASNPEIQQKYQEKRQEIISNTRPIKLTNGQTLSPQRLESIVAGIDGEYTVENRATTGTGVGATGTGTYAYNTTKYQIIDRAGKVVADNLPLAEQLAILDNTREGSYKAALDTYLGQNTAVQKMGLSTGDLFSKGSIGENYLKTVFGSNLGVIGESATGEGVVFNSMGGLDPVTGKVIIQATDKDGQISFKKLRDAMAKSGVAQSFYGKEVEGNPNAMEITLPEAVGIVKEPLYADVLRQQLNYLEKRAPTLPNTGVQLQVGRDRSGVSYAIKVKKKLGSNAPEYTILANGNELPFKNSNQIDPKENALIQLDRLLGGELNKVQQ